MAKLVSTTYGDALFDLAMEENILHEMRMEAEALEEIFTTNQELQEILAHPKMEKKGKIALMENIFKGKCSQHMMGFLVLLVEKGRQSNLQEILAYFIDKAKEAEGIGKAYVTTAVELTEKGKAVIEKRLMELTRYESFETIYEVEESLIGGMVIRIGDRVVDSSVRTKLQNMRKSLIKG